MLPSSQLWRGGLSENLLRGMKTSPTLESAAGTATFMSSCRAQRSFELKHAFWQDDSVPEIDAGPLLWGFPLRPQPRQICQTHLSLAQLRLNSGVFLKRLNSESRAAVQIEAESPLKPSMPNPNSKPKSSRENELQVFRRPLARRFSTYVHLSRLVVCGRGRRIAETLKCKPCGS